MTQQTATIEVRAAEVPSRTTSPVMLVFEPDASHTTVRATSCAVVRNEDGLRQALAEIAGIEQRVPDIDVRPTSEGYGDLAHALDLRASLAAASATVRGALERRETRGAHVRSDFPELDTDLGVNFQISLDDGA